jgi:glycogen operon protein
MAVRMRSGTPHKLGAQLDGDGVNFGVFSENASKIEVCLFSRDDHSEIARYALPERTGPIWHGYLTGLPAGALYGYRAHGTYAPEHGHRFNPHKLLLDPYAREIEGTWANVQHVYGYDPSSSAQDLSFDTRDSAPFVPKSVVSDPALFAPLGNHSGHPWEESFIYETHVKGMTMEHPGVDAALRGTYEGLASEPVLEHLQKLGVTTVEIMPVHAFVDDSFLLDKGLRNYWGYNSIGFFAAEPRYFGPAGIAGFREMVRRFHAAGIEVILDVVYNHTAEGDHRGPTLCFRGLDNASYYRLINGQPRYYVNDTGCGNTVNVSHPQVLRLVMDSLRYWVTVMGINGFRFDLATTLGREHHGFDPNGSFFDALRQDPVLAGVKLIAEPWDIGPGGYRLGEFTPEFAEWNDTARDTIRKFWRGDAHAAQELGARLLGSAEKFDRNGRRAWSSINFVASHDGFTLNDVASYAKRHNDANLENNQDGHGANYSDNFGVEGRTDDPDILARRQRRKRNLLATLFLCQGTPMLLAGDEIGNSQHGNNNAYCQDNPIGWVNWGETDEDLLAFVQKLSAFRAAHSTVRQPYFLHAGKRPADGLPDVEWWDLEGNPLNWRDPGLSSLCLLVRYAAEAPDFMDEYDTVFVVFNRDTQRANVKLPPRPEGTVWIHSIDTANPSGGEAVPLTNGHLWVEGKSVNALVLGTLQGSML